jgi:hypothetical protein
MDFSSAEEKWSLLYTSSMSDPQQREKRKQGLQPSEIKALRFAPTSSFAIAPEGTTAWVSFTRLLKEVDLVSFGKQGLFSMENYRQPIGKCRFFPI